MDRLQAFDENFFSFAEMLSGAPGGAALPFKAPSLAAASGQPYAGENYAIFGAGAESEDVSAALSFSAIAARSSSLPGCRRRLTALRRYLRSAGCCADGYTLRCICPRKACAPVRCRRVFRG